LSKIKFIKRLRKYHKWPSILLSLFVLIFAVSGIVMNHRSLFSSVDIPRKYLLDDYKYQNWNNAAVKSACKLSPDSILIYGNIGVWLTDSSFTSFTDFNHGFPAGIDNRKIFKLYYSNNGNLYAGTLFGLAQYDYNSGQWQLNSIPVHDKRVVDLMEKNDSLFILTRSYLLTTPDEPGSFNFKKYILPQPENYQDNEGLFKTLWVIHSGEIAGFAGKLFVDFIGLVFIFLTITGLIYWLFPKWIRKRKRNEKQVSSIAKVNRFSLKWHNKIGIWVAMFLVVTTLTGMFLRPPLLITIASSKVGKIPFTILDSPNPWYDKLRRIIYDEQKDQFLVGTNQGIYLADGDLNSDLKYIHPQPPISVMGINVFKKIGNGNYLVGSFNGLFIWNPDFDRLVDIYNPQANVHINKGGPPLSENMTAGFIDLGNQQFVFDYNRGVETLNQSIEFPKMPEDIRKASPMSLWNLALEFHTGRYYSFILGKLYILFIPLFGLTMLLILTTGFWLWWKIYRRKRI